jgi:beta-lactamase regulating signal transducer with metallopeptidase domain
MFAARGIVISSAVWVIIYCTLSLAVSVAWRRVSFLGERPARHFADLLFACRILPLLAASAITAVFTVPSFLLLEPRSIAEPVGVVPLALGLMGFTLVILGAARACRSLLRARRALSQWSRSAPPVDDTTSVPLLRISGAVPPMTAAGILRPRVLLSGEAESYLTSGELQAALNHEFAHVRRRDNLRKLLLRFLPFPGMRNLESVWLEATEIAADDASVTNAAEALDLAAALIKVSRLAPLSEPVELTASLVRAPSGAMHARIARLLAWRELHSSQSSSQFPRRLLAAAVAAVLMLIASYSHILIGVHQATEWLVR